MYVYAANNPIKYTDPDGRDAWNSFNEWTPEYIEQYSQYVDSKIEQYQNNNQKFTCEDLSLCLLIDFASENNLPITITNGTGTYSSNSEDFSSIEEFKETVLSSTGACDLKFNTIDIDISKMQAGDLICMDIGTPWGPQDGEYSHIQVINIRLGDCFGIRQGNIERGSSKYNSVFYGGEYIQNRVYNFKKDIFMNINKGSSVPEATSAFGMAFRRWDFYKWNPQKDGTDKQGAEE
ncbi:hypothetical protein [Treponema sp.]|uniref:hypothetical protein n=1 Tax=Treponema sp. TaxID=166 RepID=UPI00298DBFC3|nr:hypothetical protein [Treponema sp.]MCR5614472.1 hypothetical protein [Treponema sp.]